MSNDEMCLISCDGRWILQLQIALSSRSRISLDSLSTVNVSRAFEHNIVYVNVDGANHIEQILLVISRMKHRMHSSIVLKTMEAMDIFHLYLPTPSVDRRLVVLIF